MGGIFELLGALTATSAVYGVYKLAKVAYGQWTSPLNILPGLPFSQFFLGNLKEIWAEVSLCFFLNPRLTIAA